MAGKPPVARIKAKRVDGTELEYTMRDGSKARSKRVEIAVVWENEGRKTVKFAHPGVQAAVEKALGGPCYFDLFEGDAPTTRQSREAAEADDDF